MSHRRSVSLSDFLFIEGVTYNGTTYTVKQLLTEVAKLMDKTVVTES